MPTDSRDVIRAKAKLQEVKDKDSAGDYDAAHGLEDIFHVWALKKVRSGHPQSKKLAGIALQTTKLDFDRYTA